MEIEEKFKRLEEIYERFEYEVKEFKKHAVCKKGCADCCKQMAKIELTTLEALRIKKEIENFDKSLKLRIKKRLKKDLQKKKRMIHTTCPFLSKDDSCLIYKVRPFSCRWIYSLKKCNGGSPLIHRQVFEIAKKAIRELKELDNNGYSGHISAIFWLLEETNLEEFYLYNKLKKVKVKKDFIVYGVVPNVDV